MNIPSRFPLVTTSLAEVGDMTITTWRTKRNTQLGHPLLEIGPISLQTNEAKADRPIGIPEKCRWSQKVTHCSWEGLNMGTDRTTSTSSTRKSTFGCLWSDGAEVVVSSLDPRWDSYLHEQTTLGMSCIWTVRKNSVLLSHATEVQ